MSSAQILKFPKQITYAQIIREYNFCTEAMQARSERMDEIAEEIQNLNGQAVALNAEASFINQELQLITLRLNNLSILITKEEEAPKDE